MCATPCLSAWVQSIYLSMRGQKPAASAGSCAPRIARDAWLHVRGSSCVVRLMRLCIQDGCWVTEMIYTSRMDSQLGGSIRLTAEALSWTRGRKHMANTHEWWQTHTQAQPNPGLAVKSPKLSPEVMLGVWKQTDRSSVVDWVLKGVSA